MNIIGIDPGAGGAIVSYNKDELLVYDMPTFQIKKGKNLRTRIDTRGVLKILRDEKPDHVFVEQVSAQPGNGAAHAFSYGWACCAIDACLIALDIPYTYVASQTWKKKLSCPKEKDGARLRASQLFPAFSHNWDRKKDDGRAEAAMIALYGYQNIVS